MATSSKTLKTRIQLKSDTEANWDKAGPKDGSRGFVPLLGELIVYNADATHPFSRLKVGDGITNVVNLPFIDSGTLNGNETEIVKKENYASFPSVGSPDKLYVDLTNKAIYHYDALSGYTQLSHFQFDIKKLSVSQINEWKPGVSTKATIKDNTLQINDGVLPTLSYINAEVVQDIK